MGLIEKVTELCKDVVEQCGVSLYEVKFERDADDGQMHLTFFIDSESGITLSDCEAVSKAVDPLLEEANLIDGEYHLDVSSLGIDHPSKQGK